MLWLRNDPISPLWRRDRVPLLVEDATFATLDGLSLGLRFPSLFPLTNSCSKARSRDFRESSPRTL